MKVDYIKNINQITNNHAQVEKLINNIEKAKDIKSIVNNDINKQEQTFKTRLEEKRKKIQLSTSDITEQVQVIKNKRTQEGAGHKSFILENKNELINDDQNEGNVDENQNFLNDLDTSFDKMDLNMNNMDLKNKIEEIDDNFGSHVVNNNMNMNVNQSVGGDSNYKQIKIKTPKSKQIFSDIKTNIDHFLSEFNFYFYEDIFQRVVEEIERILEEKHKKTLEISKNYHNQIKEMEFLQTSGNNKLI